MELTADCRNMASSLRTILFSARFLKPTHTYMACHNYIHDLKCKKLLIQEFGDPLKVVQSTVEDIRGPKDDEVGYILSLD